MFRHRMQAGKGKAPLPSIQGTIDLDSGELREVLPKLKPWVKHHSPRPKPPSPPKPRVFQGDLPPEIVTLIVQSLGERCRNSEEHYSRTKPTKPLVNVMRANHMCKVIAERVLYSHIILRQSWDVITLGEHLAGSSYGPLIETIEIRAVSIDEYEVGSFWSSITFMLSAAPNLVALTIAADIPSVMLGPLILPGRVGLRSLAIVIESLSDTSVAAKIITRIPTLTSLKVRFRVEGRGYENLSDYPLLLPNLKELHVWHSEEASIRALFSWLGASRFHKQCTFSIKIPDSVVEQEESELLNTLWTAHESRVVDLRWRQGSLTPACTLFVNSHIQEFHCGPAMLSGALIPLTKSRSPPKVHLHTWIPARSGYERNSDIDEDPIWASLEALYSAHSGSLSRKKASDCEMTIYVCVTTGNPRDEDIDDVFGESATRGDAFHWYRDSPDYDKLYRVNWPYEREYVERMETHRTRLHEVGIIVLDGNLL